MMNGKPHPPQTPRPTDGGATVTPEDRLIGLIVKHRVPAADVNLRPEHFSDPDLRYTWERWAKLGSAGVAQLDMDAIRARPNRWARFTVWLVDTAAAPDPDNAIDPRDEIATIAEQIRGRNEQPPPAQPTPSPEPKPSTKKKKPAPAKPPRQRRISDDAELIEGARSLIWLSHAGRTPGLTHLEAHVLLFIAAHISGGKKGTGAAFPAVATIAEGVGSDRSSVRRAVDRLVELSLFAVDPGGGRHRSNTHRIALPKHLAGIGKSETRAPSEAQKKKAPTTRSTTPAHPLPPDWRPTTEDSNSAIEELGLEVARSELATFRDWNGSRGIKRCDWNAAWRNWVRRKVGWETGAARRYGRTR
jgi:hypothetical protein